LGGRFQPEDAGGKRWAGGKRAANIVVWHPVGRVGDHTHGFGVDTRVDRRLQKVKLDTPSGDREGDSVAAGEFMV